MVAGVCQNKGENCRLPNKAYVCRAKDGADSPSVTPPIQQNFPILKGTLWGI